VEEGFTDVGFVLGNQGDGRNTGKVSNQVSNGAQVSFPAAMDGHQERIYASFAHHADGLRHGISMDDVETPIPCGIDARPFSRHQHGGDGGWVWSFGAETVGHVGFPVEFVPTLLEAGQPGVNEVSVLIAPAHRPDHATIWRVPGI